MGEEEQYLLKCLEELKEEYERAAEPYIRRLALLRSFEPPPPIVLSREDAEALRKLRNERRKE